ncbi:PilZ domain-containing protein [Desulfococcaceae bacterium HSG8]|nr:PilZ domain-containing protein [Desulfococcaceae bacterium HSG8]
MKENHATTTHERRMKFRTTINRYYSVQFLIKDIGSVYQFILRDISSNGMCILIEEDSVILDYLTVGKIMRMKYYPSELLGQTEFIKTEIRHITRDNQGRLKGYFKVGLAVLERY